MGLLEVWGLAHPAFIQMVRFAVEMPLWGTKDGAGLLLTEQCSNLGNSDDDDDSDLLQ
jgi:hypothetical protein